MSDDDLADPVRRRIRVLLVRQVLEQQAAALRDAADGPAADRLHSHVPGRLMILTAGVSESDWPAAYGLATLAATVYDRTCEVLHGKRAFADVPETLVREWEQVAMQVRDAVAAGTQKGGPVPRS